MITPAPPADASVETPATLPGNHPPTVSTALETRQQQYLRELGAIPSSYKQWLDSLGPEKQQRVRNSVNRMKHGLHATAPLTCTGIARCPFANACPIPDRKTNGELIPGPEGQYPIGQACVLEGEYMIQKVGEYLVHLDVDPGNPIEVSIVQELALIDLQKNRALLILSHGDREGQGRDFMHVDESVTGFSQGGRDQVAQPLISKTTKLHPVLEYGERLERRRLQWHDKLMETRKAKADWAAKMGTTQVESRVLTEIAELKTFLRKAAEAPVPLLTNNDDDEDDKGIGLDEEL